jgi:hypothetical protein
MKKKKKLENKNETRRSDNKKKTDNEHRALFPRC